MERRRRNEDVFPGNAKCAMAENRKAERPKPDMTRPVVVPRYILYHYVLSDVVIEKRHVQLYPGMSLQSC